VLIGDENRIKKLGSGEKAGVRFSA